MRISALPGVMSSPRWLRALAIVAFAISLAVPTPDCFARGGGGGFSGGARSSSFSSSRSFGGWGSSSHSFSSGRSSSFSSRPSSNSGWGSSASRSYGPSSAADNALGSKVNQVGNTTSRGQAAAAQARTGSQTGYQSQQQPGQTNIPAGTTLPDGQYAPIYYNSTYGGYGFWDSLGHWVMWNAILGGNHTTNYYNYGSGGPYSSYGPYSSGPGYGYYGSGYHSHLAGAVFSLFLLGLFLVFILVAIGIYFYWKHSTEVAEEAAFQQASTRPLRSASLGATTYQATTMEPSPQLNPPRPSQLDDWINLRPGAQLILSDAQALADSQKRGEGRMGILFTVQSVGVIDDSEQLATWVLIHLNDGTQPLVLLVKGVDNEMDLRVYYRSDDFQPARRETVVSRGDLWLFQEPPDPENYDASDLLYTTEIHQTVDGRDVVYLLKEQGERHGAYTEKPARTGVIDLLATIAEYSTADSTENPELLAVEIGAATRGTGEVSIYLGSAIRPNEVELTKR